LLIAAENPTQTNEGFDFVTVMRVNVTYCLKVKGSILEVVQITRYSTKKKVIKSSKKKKNKKKNTLRNLGKIYIR
jgi:hypothetical protein